MYQKITIVVGCYILFGYLVEYVVKKINDSSNKNKQQKDKKGSNS